MNVLQWLPPCCHCTTHECCSDCHFATLVCTAMTATLLHLCVLQWLPLCYTCVLQWLPLYYTCVYNSDCHCTTLVCTAVTATLLRMFGCRWLSLQYWVCTKRAHTWACLCYKKSSLAAECDSTSRQQVLGSKSVWSRHNAQMFVVCITLSYNHRECLLNLMLSTRLRLYYYRTWFELCFDTLTFSTSKLFDTMILLRVNVRDRLRWLACRGCAHRRFVGCGS